LITFRPAAFQRSVAVAAGITVSRYAGSMVATVIARFDYAIILPSLLIVIAALLFCRRRHCRHLYRRHLSFFFITFTPFNMLFRYYATIYAAIINIDDYVHY